MNQRNMEELAVVLGEHRVVHSMADALALAVFLTARGVLVPSVLTEEQITALCEYAFSNIHATRQGFRAMLEACARGDVEARVT